MPSFKTGRLPATRPAVLRDFEVYAQGVLPVPPPSVAPPSVPYPIDGNARYGDCTIAGVAHLIAAWNADAGQSLHVPDEDEVISTYLGLTGGKDAGCNEADVLQRWQSGGLFDERIAGYAPINPKDLLGIRQGVAFYGGVYLGILCPSTAQQQFAADEPWTYLGEQTEDGHCIVALGYLPNGSLLCATWGGVAEVTAGFLAHYLEEAWVILSQQFVNAKGDQLGVDLTALQADISRL